MAAGLTFLFMRQVMPLAAGLASGLSLSTFGLMSQTLARAFGGAVKSSGQFARGALFDREPTRWDSLSRKGGYHLGNALSGGVRKVAAHWRENAVSRR